MEKRMEDRRERRNKREWGGKNEGWEPLEGEKNGAIKSKRKQWERRKEKNGSGRGTRGGVFSCVNKYSQ